MGPIFKFLRWLYDKFAVAALIVTLGVATWAVWLFLHDKVDFDEWRRVALRSAENDRAKVRSALDEVHRRMDRLSNEIAAEQEKGRQADKVIAQLRELESTWDKVFGDRAQQQTNARRLEDVTKIRLDATARIAALQNEFTRTTWERDGLDIALAKAAAQVQTIEAQRSKTLHYLSLAWERARWWVAAALGFYFLGPTLGKLALYFWFAPWVVAGRPMRLRYDLEEFPEVGESKVSANFAIAPGERLWVRKKFLSAKDRMLPRKTRYFLDWRIPVSCFSSGLVPLVEILHGPQEAEERRFTFSHPTDPGCAFTILTLREGSAIVLRPSVLAGVVTVPGTRLKIRRWWQVLRWQPWVTGQFRFLEFFGPCLLIVANEGGMQPEHLVEGRNNELPARRTPLNSTLGFTPNLEYRPMRTETFWSYYRGMSSLFDEFFCGRGIFLCRKIPATDAARKPRPVRPPFRARLLKIFGV